MSLLPLAALCLCLVSCQVTQAQSSTNHLPAVVQQLIMQQLFMEERIWSDGQSGIKQVRINQAGSSIYHEATHTSHTVGASHEHADFNDTIAMGELTAVLNGVEFTTRHNDYRTVKPSTTSTEYGKTEDMVQPDVPPAVTSKATVQEQIAEMKLWFKAFLDQDYSVRDYRPYFKPALCYLEGAWTTNTDNLTEPFDSKRHSLDATSWYNLLQKVLFTAHTGSKDGGENLSYLPTKVFNVTADGQPILAQWNYRLLCHPLKNDLPLNRLQLVDDLSARMMFTYDINTAGISRGARFRLNLKNQDEFVEERATNKFLDDLIYGIPGADNYPGNLTDDAFGYTAKVYNSNAQLNAAYYHHIYELSKAGAMGLKVRNRAYSDPTIYMAMTSSPRIQEVCFDDCKKDDPTDCTQYCQRWTYAIPMEIIYMTPLNKWNPYNIEYKGDFASDLGKTVHTGRNGDTTDSSKAYNGSNSQYFYQTPVEFFGPDGLTDPADTSNKEKGVLNQSGELVKCKASGFRISFNVADVGYFRQRYIIAPVHGQGSSVWKELEALKAIVLRNKRYPHMFHNVVPAKFGLNKSTTKASGQHTHELPELTVTQMNDLYTPGTSFNVTSLPFSDGHTHNVTVYYDEERPDGDGRFKYSQCDNKNRCHHPQILFNVEDPVRPRQAPLE